MCVHVLYIFVHVIMSLYLNVLTCACVCMYKCMYDYKCVSIGMLGCIHNYVYVLCTCMGGYMCIYVYACPFVLGCVFRLVRLGPDPDSCSLWTRYIDDLKIDPRDDPEIRTSSCSENPTVIRTRN